MTVIKAIKEIWLRSTPAKGNRIEPILNEIGIAKATLNEVDGFKPNEQTSKTAPTAIAKDIAKSRKKLGLFVDQQYHLPESLDFAGIDERKLV